MTTSNDNRNSITIAGLTLAVASLLAVGLGSTAYGAVGDKVQVVNATGFIDAEDVFCSIGLSFDGTHLYWDACNMGTIWITDTAPTPAVVDSRNFTAEIPEFPNAMAFDATRGVTYVGTQGQSVDGCPVYEIDHQGTFDDLSDDIVTELFTIPSASVSEEIGNCFVDGLAYNQNDPLAGADAIYVSGDAQERTGVYLLDGTLVQTINMTSIDPAASTTSGLAVGGDNLYIANNGGGDVLRASLPSLALLDQFVSADERQEDMECDPVSFGSTEVMWLRTTPQGGFFPNVATAFEIEPGTCEIGGGEEAVDVKKTYTFTDVNFEERCEEFEEVIDPETGEVVGEECVSFRPANINLDDDVFAEDLPFDEDDSKFFVNSTVHPRNDKILNYNPGQYYAVTNVTINSDVDGIKITENFGDCTARDGPNVSELNPNKVPGGAFVVIVTPDGDVFDVSGDLANDGKLAITGDGIITADIDEAVLAQSQVYMGVKFAPGLVGEKASSMMPDDLMCNNTETVEFESGGEVSDPIVAEADLKVVFKE